MRNAVLPILVIGIAVGCGEAAPNTPAPGPVQAQAAPLSPDLSGTYSDESGSTIITVDRLSESAYALTLSDGRTVICRPRDGLLEGTLNGSPVTARFEGAEATVIAFGRRLAYRKVSDEIRPIPLAQGDASAPPTPSGIVVPPALPAAAEENAPAEAEVPAPVQVAVAEPQVRSSESEKPRPAEPSTQGPESDAPVLVGIVTVDRESITGELVSESDTQLELADLVTGDPQTFDKARLTSVRRGLSEREAMLRVELPRFLAWKIRRSLPLGTSAGKVAAIDGAIAYVSLGDEAGARPGDELIVYRGSGQIVDPDTGAVLGSQQRRIARLTITETQERFSKARLLGDLEVQLQAGDQVEFAVQKKAIAILPWVDVNGRETTVGKSNAEELTTELVRGRIPVVERALLNKVLAELRLQQTAAFDPTTAQRVGRMLGAKAVLAGTIVFKAKYAEAHLRLIDVETGEILFTASQKLSDRPVRISATRPSDAPGELPAGRPAEREPVLTSAGAVPLFDGGDLAAWQTTPEARRHWKSAGGLLTCSGRARVNLTSKQSFGNFILKAEWRVAPGSDSGIYLRGVPQLQLWDPARPAAQGVGSGGLFNNKSHPSRPLRKADRPAGACESGESDQKHKRQCRARVRSDHQVPRGVRWAFDLAAFCRFGATSSNPRALLLEPRTMDNVRPGKAVRHNRSRLGTWHKRSC